MAKAIDNVSMEDRWNMSTKALTGAIMGYNGAIIEGMGIDAYNDFAGVLWGEAGKQSKQIAYDLNLPANSPADINLILETMALALMGPEFDWEVSEESDTKCVGTAKKCPWHERAKEQGLKADFCGVPHQKWGENAVAQLSDEYTFKMTKSLQLGDDCCEYVIEKK